MQLLQKAKFILVNATNLAFLVAFFSKKYIIIIEKVKKMHDKKKLQKKFKRLNATYNQSFFY